MAALFTFFAKPSEYCLRHLVRLKPAQNAPDVGYFGDAAHGSASSMSCRPSIKVHCFCLASPTRTPAICSRICRHERGTKASEDDVYEICVSALSSPMGSMTISGRKHLDCDCCAR